MYQQNHKKTRYNKGQVTLTDRDERVLRWISEQQAARFDQVQYLLGQDAGRGTLVGGRSARARPGKSLHVGDGPGGSSRGRSSGRSRPGYGQPLACFGSSRCRTKPVSHLLYGSYTSSLSTRCASPSKTSGQTINGSVSDRSAQAFLLGPLKKEHLYRIFRMQN